MRLNLNKSDIDLIIEWNRVCNLLGSEAGECGPACDFVLLCGSLIDNMNKGKNMSHEEKSILLFWTLTCQDINECEKCTRANICKDLRLKIWKTVSPT
jgi:hypothetical protein